MNDDLKPRQRLAVFALVFGRTAEEREPLVSKTLLDRRQWKELEQRGLVELSTRPKKRGTFVTLTDKGWDWASNHLVGSLGRVPVLESVLECLARFLERSGESLANFAQGLDVRSGRALPDRIRSACLDIAGGVGKRVLLRDLRRRLGDVRREALDHALLELQERERIVLYRLDNPAELTPADEQAALLIAGNPRHVVYLES